VKDSPFKSLQSSFSILLSPDFFNYELCGQYAGEWRNREIRMKGEVSPVVADGQGDAEDGEGYVSKIRESHVGRGGLTCSFHFTAYSDLL
jgi:hypothetical protein